MERLCQECGINLNGRIDQKFCSDQCRNTFNNRQNRDETRYMKNVGRILRKNRRILRNLKPNGKALAGKNTLLAMGFNFRYFTHIQAVEEGRVIYFCYEYGYMPMENDYFALVKEKDT